MAKYNTLTELFTAIANSLRGKTGGTGKIVADDFPSVIDGLSTGGITPTGTKTITTNGEHDVTSYAKAKVNVPVGTTPTGTKTITANGEHDVADFAKALVNVTGLNARVFTATVSKDVTSGQATIAGANSFIASLVNNSNAFVLVRHTSPQPSTAMSTLWFNSNQIIAHQGATAYKSVYCRNNASYASAYLNIYGLTGQNWMGSLSVKSDGSLYVNIDSNFPVKAGTYQIIAGTMEML